MITESRWKHILGVARKAKALAEKMRPNDNCFAQDMFLLGMLHDFGYEFSETGKDHAVTGGKILKRQGYKYWQEVAAHGHPDAVPATDELFILNCADMMTNAGGEECTMEERISDIAKRYGRASPAYEKSVFAAKQLQSDARYIYLKNE